LRCFQRYSSSIATRYIAFSSQYDRNLLYTFEQNLQRLFDDIHHFFEEHLCYERGAGNASNAIR